jgi:hypothetical protein
MRPFSLPSPPRGVTRHRDESIVAWIWSATRTLRKRRPAPPPSTLDLAALRDAQLAATSSAAGPFFDLREVDTVIADSEDVTGALLAHIDRAFRGRFPSHPKPSREWWDELAKLASGVHR